MTFHVTHRYGAMTSDPPLSSLPELLRELDDRPDDTEHDSVSVSHESEWCMSVWRGGYIVLEHLEDGGERHMLAVPDSKIVEMWSRLAEGDIASLELEPWMPGYGT
jgi:hypothetical protein